jgi:hypothetical protein
VQNKIYSSYLYFTKQKEADFPEDVEDSTAKSQKWERETKRESTFDFSSFGYLDTSDLPRFTYVPPTIGNDLSAQLYLIVGILIVCILLFWFSFISFIKYDVR